MSVNAVFADNISMYCRENAITDAEFERRCGLTKAMVEKWKHGKNKTPSVASLLKIEKGTGIPSSEWLRQGGVYGQKTG